VPETNYASARWTSDAYLDTLASLGDLAADACLAALPVEDSLSFAFSQMGAGQTLPPVLPPAFEAYLRAPGGHTLTDLTDDDRARLNRGQHVFLTHALPMGLALLTKSLPEGYQAPRLANVLMLSGGLEMSTYRRILGVLQMLLSVNQEGSFERVASDAPGGGAEPGTAHSEAAMTALRVRLMHAGIRSMAKKKLPDFSEHLGGIPVSLEDMLYTILAFSLQVLQGIELMRIPLTPAQRDDYFFVWRVFARCMGIHPADSPTSWEFIPETLIEAEMFNRSYGRRHFRTLTQNPNAKPLIAAQGNMIAQRLTFGLLPTLLAPSFIPRMFFEQMIGADAAENIGVRRVRWLRPFKPIILRVPRVWSATWSLYDRLSGSDARHVEYARRLFQSLILWQYDGAATLRIVRDSDDTADLVRGTRPGLEYGLQQFRQSVFPTELGQVLRRRAALGQNTSALSGPPSTDRGLTGLSLSGGGIRSAAYSLGVVQALAERRTLRNFDYLSTVSGGGYFGSALSSALTDPAAGLDGQAFPFDYQQGAEEPPGVRQLRNGSNFLVGGDLMTELRLPMIIMRGLVINAVLFLPYLIFAAWITWVAYPYLHDDGVSTWFGLAALTAFMALMTSYPAVSFLFGRRFTWSRRDRYENLQAISLAVLASAVIIAVLSVPVQNALGTDWVSLTARMRKDLEHPFDPNHLWKWTVFGLTLLALTTAGRASKAMSRRVNQLFILILGILGPALVFGAYLLLLVAYARSPDLPIEEARVLSLMTARAPGQPLPAGTRRLFDDLQSRGIILDPVQRVIATSPDSIWHVRDTHRVWHTITLRTSYLALSGVEFGSRPEDWWFIGAALIVFVLNGMWVDVNISSAHGFYRDRLSRAFLFRSRWYGRTTPNDAQKMSALGIDNPVAPYHLINTALNLNGEEPNDLPGRRSDFFVISKCFVGSFATGYCDTRDMEAADPRLDLGTAMAISGAAAAPNAGTTTIRPLTFILTLLNVRLGYWLPNPWYVQAPSLVRRLRVRQRPGPNYLLREGLGLLSTHTSFVNISDGGHIENLGAFELLRRRCAVIVVVDAECDPTMACPSLAKLTRYARTDLGVEIDIETSALQPNAAGCAERHWVIGTIHYDDQETGCLLYVKAGITGDEAPYVLDYKRAYPAFPHEPTSDQFFDEAQFEAYRALGYHSLLNAFDSIAALDGNGGASPAAVAQLRQRFGFATATTTAPPPGAYRGLGDNAAIGQPAH
jgi:hypothetical protein